MKRCSDYDADCADVSCPISCWLGGVFGEYWTAPSDGYCPLLRAPVEKETAHSLEPKA